MLRVQQFRYNFWGKNMKSLDYINILISSVIKNLEKKAKEKEIN